jgi:hypothetical protein
MKKVFKLVILFFMFFLFQSFMINNVEKEIYKENIQDSGCEANLCLDETCRSFIARCRKGGIHSEFPGQFYDVKIRVVKSGKTDAHKKAWKLLNDGRFKK